MSAGGENNIKNFYEIVVLWYDVASRRDFSKDMLIFHSYSIKKNGNFYIFWTILGE